MPKKRLITVVEDEPALAENYRIALERAGFRVDCHATAAEAMQAFNQALPDLALVDIGLPDDPEGGFEICRELRRLSATLPILFLTARDSELDVISGLRLGADDYLVKSISLEQLIVRIRALFRRVDAVSAEASRKAVIHCGPLSLDDELLQAKWRDQPVALTVTEFWLVHALASRPGQVKTRQQLMEAASVFFDDQTITAHIKRIRRKFKALDDDFESIQTVYGMGYRWQPEAANL